MTHFYAQELENVFANLNTTKKGLASEEAQKRLAQYGLNEIKEAEKISPVKIFFSQFSSLIVWILITAMAISAMLGEVTDAVVIGVILAANAVIGFVQEYKAERAIDALRKMAAPKATVLRDGVVEATYRKRELPNYDVFDEKRTFDAGSEPCIVELKGARAYSSLLSPLVAGSLERASNLAEAMEARGFGREGLHHAEHDGVPEEKGETHPHRRQTHKAQQAFMLAARRLFFFYRMHNRGVQHIAVHE